MRAYLHLLRRRDFALLWSGATVSILGDGMTLVALVWLVLERTGSAVAVGWLTFAYSAPVVLGGLAAGVVLDRFDRVGVLAIDTLARGLLMASVPVLELAGGVPTWWLFVVAGGYGLLKMVPLAGVPALIPSLVDEDELTTANAMESMSYGAGGIVGPALAGVLVAIVGAPAVVGLDAVTYFAFLACLLAIRRPRHASRAAPGGRGGATIGNAARLLVRSPAILATTLMFMAANVGEGVVTVALPMYVAVVLTADAAAYGGLLAAMSAGLLVGSVAVGAVATPRRLVRAIALAQLLGGAVLAGLLLRPALPGALAVGLTFGLATSPLTIWAQTVRMRVIAPELRGRVFALLRTMMQSTPPAGGLVAGLAISGLGLEVALLVAIAMIAGPALAALAMPHLDAGAAHPGLAPATVIE